MTQQLHATFDVTSWQETPFDEGTGVAKLTEALVEKAYSGDVEGTSTTKWLMAYAPDQSADTSGSNASRAPSPAAMAAWSWSMSAGSWTGRPARP